jgi:beta-mannanase
MIAWAGSDLAAIARGDHDALIRRRARGVRRFARPLFIRWGYEMNGDWWDWSTARTGGDPSTYVAAWRRIHRLFRAAGVTNAVWVWSPNERSFPDAPWNRTERYYPGDDVVDWVGIDGYNWGAANASGWRSFADIIRPLYRRYAGRKPLMVSETASAEAGGDKAAWIAAAHRSLAGELPAVRALVWFHSHKETDWRVDSSAPALAAFRRLARDPGLAVG